MWPLYQFRTAATGDGQLIFAPWSVPLKSERALLGNKRAPLSVLGRMSVGSGNGFPGSCPAGNRRPADAGSAEAQLRY